SDVCSSDLPSRGYARWPAVLLTCPIHEHVSAGRRARALPTPPVVPVATARYGRTDATGGRRVHLRPAGPRAGRRPYAAVGTAAGDAAAQRWAAHAHRLVDVRVRSEAH